MPDASPTSDHRAVARRTLLRGGMAAGVVGLLTSCSTIAGAPVPGATESGSGLPAGEAPLTPYADLAAQLTQAADEFSVVAAMPGAPSATTTWAARAAAMCRAQSRPLETPDPLSAPGRSMASPEGVGSATPSATATPELASLLASIAARQRGLAAQFRAACLVADAGGLTLMLASLAVAAHAVRAPSTPVTSGDVTPRHVDVGSRNDALAVLLSRVEALAQGLEVGIGALPRKDPNALTGETRLAEVWSVRDDLEGRLLQASATPTPGPLVYDLPGTTESPKAVLTLWGRLENDVMDAWLRLAAASTAGDRATAVDAAMDHQDRAAALGVGVTYWPGWV